TLMMKSKPWWKSFFSWGVVLGGLGVGGVLVVLLITALILLHPAGLRIMAATPVVTLIPAPTLTPAIAIPTNGISTATPTLSPSQQSPASGSIQIGTYVQIGDTGGAGLRIRSDPGVSSSALFLGLESEVYQVTKGPQQKDGYTWWYLVAPYDKNRSGWAAANYLVVIQRP
ncbi:MAG: hypothetical protein PHQ40_20425, partial [Anaerolineaceae bacterium]|nr:hypothetical protein [Anaerolineaceae bacterium]